jgi:gamma-glutamylcyclotransferase (GGCT)/AIG2-like uncharacterized protein YtfP
MSTLHHIFVYGTLRAEAPNPMAAFLKTAANLVSAATISGKLFLVEKNRDFIYPALILPSNSNSNEETNFRIVGDVLKIKDEILNDEAKLNQVWQRLDDYEGSEYAKRIQKVILKNAEQTVVECYVYEFVASVEGLKLIKNGDFLRREV